MSSIRWAVLIVLVTAPTRASDDLSRLPAWRKPSAAVLIDDGQFLAVANEGTGTVSLIALPKAGDGKSRILSESPIGTALTDLVAIPNSNWLLATDFSGRLSSIRRQGDTLEPSRPLDRQIPEYAVSICLSGDGRVASIASLWARCVTLGSISVDDNGPKVDQLITLPLDFAPRLQLALDDTHILVADAFGGRLALIDVENRSVKPLKKLHGGNIRGIALSTDRKKVVFAHSIQNPLAHADFNDIHWGMLTSNVLREYPREAFINQTYADRDVQLRQIGQPEFGAADPAGLVQLPAGEWAVLTSGTGDLSFLQFPAGLSDRIPVGDRPLKLVFDGRNRLYVLDQLGDSVAVVDTAARKVVETISLGPQPEPTPASRGERLFFSAALSHDQWLSCHSCHVDGHTTDGLADTHSDGTFGTPKRILTLLGTRDANPWAWNGSFRELHEQVEQSITSSMQGPAPTLEQVSDLTAFLHTLKAAPPVSKPSTAEEEAAVAAGRRVFEAQGCGKCHVPSLTFTTDAVFDVGFTDEEGLSKFNPPSLRGVSQRSALFHDGRAKSLRSAFEDHSHQVADGLSPRDLNALIEYLRSI
ncbi:MAG TPA: cytochrome c peroxidase [Caulifigura sp.]|nr:cytochrome c peroxidase [Caulifigura sp.]